MHDYFDGTWNITEVFLSVTWDFSSVSLSLCFGPCRFFLFLTISFSLLQSFVDHRAIFHDVSRGETDRRASGDGKSPRKNGHEFFIIFFHGSSVDRLSRVAAGLNRREDKWIHFGECTCVAFLKLSRCHNKCLDICAREPTKPIRSSDTYSISWLKRILKNPNIIETKVFFKWPLQHAKCE